MATSYGNPPIVTDGLVLCLDAANPLSYPGSGTAWNDLSGQGNSGTLINGTSFNSQNSGIIVFDGSDDYANFGNILNPSQLNNNFTIEVWFNANNYFLGQSRLVSYWDWYTLMFSNGTQLSFEINAGGYKGVGTSAPPLNTWNQIVGIYNGSQLKIYKNGILSNSVNATGNIGTTNYIFNIGAFQNNVEYRISGNMGPVRVYGKELSASEVLQNYEANKTRFGL
jgi:hypothetical protein